MPVRSVLAVAAALQGRAEDAEVELQEAARWATSSDRRQERDIAAACVATVLGRPVTVSLPDPSQRMPVNARIGLAVLAHLRDPAPQAREDSE